MNEDLALFAAGTTRELVQTLQVAGYSIANPGTGHVRGWNAEGELVLLASESDGLEFLQDERGLQFWRNDTDDLFVSVVMGRPCVSFDGVDGADRATLSQAWHDAGLRFELLLEDQLEEVLGEG